MENDINREACILLLQSKFNELKRLPIKSDFSEKEIMKIKSYFGPWPHALEAAGLKTSKKESKLAHNREKRIKAKSKINLKKRTEK